MKLVRITQLDGTLPNIALMRIACYHKNQGDWVYFSKSVSPDLFEPKYDLVYGSSIFTFSKKKQELFLKNFPGAILGGTGVDLKLNVEDVIPDIGLETDYSIYPEFTPSIGFLQRGCRLKCKFCVVPEKEGKPVQYMNVNQLWRGEGNPKKLHILDNDFFGVPGWEQHIEDIIDGEFKICLTQGINVRLISDEAAHALSQIEYRDSKFQRKRLYTAWDNIGHEKIFFKGVERLMKYGIKPQNVMAYMLIGYDPKETRDAIFYRFNKMVELGVKPYPMVYDPNRKDLKRFQRWAVRGLYRFSSFDQYSTERNRGAKQKISYMEIL